MEGSATVTGLSAVGWGLGGVAVLVVEGLAVGRFGGCGWGEDVGGVLVAVTVVSTIGDGEAHECPNTLHFSQHDGVHS